MGEDGGERKNGFMKGALSKCRQADRILPALTVVVIIALWEWVVRIFSISPGVLPPPSRVAAALWGLAKSGVLFDYTVASLFRVTWGYFLAVAAAVPIGMFLGLWPLGRAVFNPIIQFLRPISPLAWIPLAILWLGIGDKPAVFLIFLAVFFPMLVCVMGSVAGIKVTYFRIAQNFGLTGYRLYTKVVLPAALPEIVVGLRITLGTAWLVIVAAEMIAVKSGLGYLIVDARNSLRMDRVIGGMVVIGIIGLALDRIIRRLETLPSVRWKRMQR
ncbi:MAG: ABC transporter permease [Desulfobacteraceae bacterium]|nr:ABC transporter permease [Desulfobacteraceae bacterium]